MTHQEMIDLGCGTQIADDADANGYEPRYLGDNGRYGDHRLSLWQCGDVEAIATNGDTVWEDQADLFVAMRQQITLDDLADPS